MSPVDTPTWKFRIDPDLRRAGIAAAKAEGDDLSSVLRAAIHAYVADPQSFNAAVAQIRGGYVQKWTTTPAGEVLSTWSQREEDAPR